MFIFRPVVLMLALLSPIIALADPDPDPTPSPIKEVTVDTVFDIRFGDPAVVPGGCGEKEGELHMKLRAWFEDCKILAEAARVSVVDTDETSRKLKLTFLAYNKKMDPKDAKGKFWSARLKPVCDTWSLLTLSLLDLVDPVYDFFTKGDRPKVGEGAPILFCNSRWLVGEL